MLRAYPCDDFVTSPTLQAWRGVHVQAPTERVWPWIGQVRLAPYSGPCRRRAFSETNPGTITIKCSLGSTSAFPVTVNPKYS